MRTKNITKEGTKYLEEFKRFQSERPAVRLTTLFKEAGMSKRYNDWFKILTGLKTLTPHYFDEYKTLRKAMKKYGF